MWRVWWLDVPVPDPEATPTEFVEDTVQTALFHTTTAPPPPPRERTKRHHSKQTSEGEGAWCSNRERLDMKDARRSSLLDEEARQMRAHELAAGPSSSRFEAAEKSTTEGADIATDTTNGVPTTHGGGSRKLDPLAC